MGRNVEDLILEMLEKAAVKRCYKGIKTPCHNPFSIVP